MRKIASLFVALLLLAGCSSVPLTGRKQVLLVSDQEVLSSSLTQYNDYIKTAKKSTNVNKSAMVTRVGKKIAAATVAIFCASFSFALLTEKPKLPTLRRSYEKTTA